MDLVVPKCQGRRIRRQFCRANDLTKDLLSLALSWPKNGKGTPESGYGQSEERRPDVPPGSSAEKRYAAFLTNQRGESLAKAKMFFCVPHCGATTRPYTDFWRFSKEMQSTATQWSGGAVLCRYFLLL